MDDVLEFTVTSEQNLSVLKAKAPRTVRIVLRSIPPYLTERAVETISETTSCCSSHVVQVAGRRSGHWDQSCGRCARSKPRCTKRLDATP